MGRRAPDRAEPARSRSGCGERRQERWAFFVHLQSVRERVSPERSPGGRSGGVLGRIVGVAGARGLEAVAGLLECRGLAWGLGKRRLRTRERAPGDQRDQRPRPDPAPARPLPRTTAREILEDLASLPARVDAQIDNRTAPWRSPSGPPARSTAGDGRWPGPDGRSRYGLASARAPDDIFAGGLTSWSVALLFPGHGPQERAYGRPSAAPRAGARSTRRARLSGRTLRTWTLGDRLRSTETAQLALLVCGWPSPASCSPKPA